MIKTEYYCDLCGKLIPDMPDSPHNMSQLCTMTTKYAKDFHYHHVCILQVEQVCKALGLMTSFTPPSVLANGYLSVKGFTL